jgi:hypothetical protein
MLLGRKMERRRFAKFTYLALARCCSRVLLELDVLSCAGLISFADYWPATGQQHSVSSCYVFESGRAEASKIIATMQACKGMANIRS